MFSTESRPKPLFATVAGGEIQDITSREGLINLTQLGLLGRHWQLEIIPSPEKDTSSNELRIYQLMLVDPGVSTWRIIPVSKWLITMVSKSPNWGYRRVVITAGNLT